MRITILCLSAAALALAGCSAQRCGHGQCRHVAAGPGRAYVSSQTHEPAAAPPGPRDIPVVAGAPDSSCAPAKPCVPDKACVPEKKPCAPEKPCAPKKKEDTQPVSTQPAERPRFGHGEEYGWLRGQLQRVHVPGSDWKLRYAPLSEVDKWGGSMVLAPDARLDDYEDGDFVYVEGEILSNRPTLYLSGPLYRVRTVRPTDASERGIQ